MKYKTENEKTWVLVFIIIIFIGIVLTGIKILLNNPEEDIFYKLENFEEDDIEIIKTAYDLGSIDNVVIISLIASKYFRENFYTIWFYIDENDAVQMGDFIENEFIRIDKSNPDTAKSILWNNKKFNETMTANKIDNESFFTEYKSSDGEIIYEYTIYYHINDIYYMAINKGIKTKQNEAP